MLQEINFDGIIGPSHNFAGMSLGNLASTLNAKSTSHPRQAALQGIAKMRANMALGLAQGFFLPHDRPDESWLASLATRMEEAESGLRAAAISASSMWAANAATVSPAPDTKDGRCHLTVANLVTMPHRSHEWPGTLAQLQLAFANKEHFAVHGPVPAPFGDEGAANHMRLARSHAEPGIEVFVYGATGGPFPARQHREASAAIARRHRLDPGRFLLAEQSAEAIAAGAFHNDVVAVANENVLFTHERAFADPAQVYGWLEQAQPGVAIVEVPAAAISLEDAISSYLFNAQLVSLPGGGMALILPTESRQNERVWSWLEQLVASNGPIRRLIPVEVRQSMRNGGGPACLRLRVVADLADVDQRFIADEAKLAAIEQVVKRAWPASIEPEDLADSALWSQLHNARKQLLGALGLDELD